jgi:hypothetical protein
MLEEWMRSYRPEALFDENGAPVAELAELTPGGETASIRLSAVFEATQPGLAGGLPAERTPRDVQLLRGLHLAARVVTLPTHTAAKGSVSSCAAHPAGVDPSFG